MERKLETLKKEMHMSNTTQTNASVINGVDRDKLLGTVGLIQATPGLAKFKFHVQNDWVDGAHNRSTIHTFFGAGTDMEHEVKFELDADEPAILLGRDQGPNAGEYLLHALAACVTSTMVYHAAARGIAIVEVESALDGDIDLRGFLGIDKNVRNGFSEIRLNFKIKADVPDDRLQELSSLGQRYSAILDTITKGVPVKVTAERMI
jgi:uncharacterized OsmC-like protein